MLVLSDHSDNYQDRAALLRRAYLAHRTRDGRCDRCRPVMISASLMARHRSQRVLSSAKTPYLASAACHAGILHTSCCHDLLKPKCFAGPLDMRSGGKLSRPLNQYLFQT